MAVIALTTEGKKLSKIEGAGPSSYPAGGFDRRVDDLEGVLDVFEAQITGGYVAKGVQSHPNIIHFTVYQQTSTSGALPEVPDGTDLSGETVKGIALGY